MYTIHNNNNYNFYCGYIIHLQILNNTKNPDLNLQLLTIY